MPKINGDPYKGIHQSEESFDYERFYQPEKTEEKENEEIDYSYPNPNFDDMSEELDAVMGLSINPSNQYKEPLSRSSRAAYYEQNSNTLQEVNVKTMCPLELKNKYESNGLYCTNLRASTWGSHIPNIRNYSY